MEVVDLLYSSFMGTVFRQQIAFLLTQNLHFFLWISETAKFRTLKKLSDCNMAFSLTGKACVAFHSYVSCVRCIHSLKNNPTCPGSELVGPDVGLFREHEVRDACVQTDPWVSGTLAYASRGPTIANQSEGQ